MMTPTTVAALAAGDLVFNDGPATTAACVDVANLVDMRIAIESGLCVHLVGFGSRVLPGPCSKTDRS